MKFINPEDVTIEMQNLDYYISAIRDAKDSYLVKLFEKCGNSSDYRESDLLLLLRNFNKNINGINIIGQTYRVSGELLSFSSLSRGEKLFVVSFAANLVNMPIILRYDIEQLTPKFLVLYLKMFLNSESIEVVKPRRSWFSTINHYYSKELGVELK